MLDDLGEHLGIADRGGQAAVQRALKAGNPFELAILTFGTNGERCLLPSN